MTFHVGQKVVCVNASATTMAGLSQLKKGAIYTIRWVGMHAYKAGHPLSGGPATLSVLLEGIYRPPTHPANTDPDMPFSASRFRPLIVRKSSTSTGFEVLDDIRKRESFDEKQRVPARP